MADMNLNGKVTYFKQSKEMCDEWNDAYFMQSKVRSILKSVRNAEKEISTILSCQELTWEHGMEQNFKEFQYCLFKIGQDVQFTYDLLHQFMDYRTSDDEFIIKHSLYKYLKDISDKLK